MQSFTPSSSDSENFSTDSFNNLLTLNHRVKGESNINSMSLNNARQTIKSYLQENQTSSQRAALLSSADLNPPAYVCALKEVAQKQEATFSHRHEAYSLLIETTNDPQYKAELAIFIKQNNHRKDFGRWATADAGATLLLVITGVALLSNRNSEIAQICVLIAIGIKSTLNIAAYIQCKKSVSALANLSFTAPKQDSELNSPTRPRKGKTHIRLHQQQKPTSAGKHSSSISSYSTPAALYHPRKPPNRTSSELPAANTITCDTPPALPAKRSKPSF